MSNFLCFDCANACGGCSWSRSFTPVEGWTATPSKIKNSDSTYVDTYHITACPQFVSDVDKYAKPEKKPRKITVKEVGALKQSEISQICAMRRNGKTYQEIINTMHLAYYTVYRILSQHGLTKRQGTIPHEQVTRLRSEGYTKAEIAEQMKCSSRTIERILAEEEANDD